MSTKRALCLIFCGAALFVPGAAWGQAKNAQSGEFSIERFEPAAGSGNFLAVERARMDGAWGWSVGLVFDYARDPFQLESCISQTNCAAPNAVQTADVHVVRDLMTWNVLAAVSPFQRLQIGLRLPIEYVGGDGINASTGLPQKGGLSTGGLGDPDLEGKVRLWGGASDPYVLGLAGDLSFPAGHATAKDAYIGNDSPVTGRIRAIFDGEAKGFLFGANFAGQFQEQAKLATTVVGPVQFQYGAGAGYKISPIFMVMAEGTGTTQFTSKNGTNALELDAAFQLQPLDSPFIFRIGGGTGVIEGVGVPAARGIASILFSHEVKDTDGDGIPDSIDKCPTLPEDFDGFEDADGCPDPDNDHDGIPDEKDKCPNQPETFNGYQDADGCPDELPDRDHDGIPDSEDKCPDEGGKIVIRNPKSPYYGCPDRDGDGIPDKIDKCPDEPEDTDGFEDEDGCPDPDNDKDGILDENDECINEPETYNGYQDADGCPDVLPNGPKELVRVEETEIKILETIEFETARSKIKGVKSFQVLDAVAGALKGHAEIAQIEIAGHTDNVGPANTNRILSQQRAEAVVAYLKGKGVSDERMVAKGYGPDKPIADNKTPAGKQKNRRVQFNILKTNKVGASKPVASAAPNAPPAPPAAPAPPAPAAPPPPKPKP